MGNNKIVGEVQHSYIFMVCMIFGILKNSLRFFLTILCLNIPGTSCSKGKGMT